MIGIEAFGGYVPRLRLNRRAIVEANSWFNPAIASLAAGERAICNWDEDSLTMAVEAARDCLSDRPADGIEAVYLASNTAPFADRQNATILATALDLDERLHTMDFTGSQRAATSGLIGALKSAKADGQTSLFVAADQREARAASTQELRFGDGAAALLVGAEAVAAEFLGAEQAAVDLVDHFRGRNERFDYTWEERWVREEGYGKIVPRVVTALLKATETEPEGIDHFIMPAPSASIPKRLAGSMGIADTAVRDNLGRVLGECGTAHVLVMLAHTLERAGPGETVLVVGWGQGCDALLFRATDAIAGSRPPMGISGFLARRREETNYNRFLAFNALIEPERGIRGEADHSLALSALYRNRRTVMGFVGGRCRKCGTAQFPRSNICVNPNCGEIRSQDPEPFADKPGSVQSWTADRLAYSPDPPSHYGMIVFEGGGQHMADMTDVDPGSVSVGMPIRMAFRVKSRDRARGYTRYFWKAVPRYVAPAVGKAAE